MHFYRILLFPKQFSLLRFRGAADEDDVLVGAVAGPRAVEVFEGHLALSIAKRRVSINDFTPGKVVTHNENVVTLKMNFFLLNVTKIIFSLLKFRQRNQTTLFVCFRLYLTIIQWGRHKTSKNKTSKKGRNYLGEISKVAATTQLLNLDNFFNTFLNYLHFSWLLNLCLTRYLIRV